MKKTLSLVLSVLLALGVFAVPGIIASAENYNGFEYTAAYGEVTITGYTGEDTAIVIPAVIDNLPVTAIANNAFKMESIESVTIPGSVASIGEEAFNKCDSLTSVTLGDGIEIIGSNAFDSCPLTSIEIPDSVVIIRASAFEYCSLKSIEIPGSVVIIDDHAFHGCSSLSSVTLGNGIERICESAFEGCPLTSIEIPDSVVRIDNCAFLGCSSLEVVTLGDSVERIGNGAFEGCPLTSIEIPDSVVRIDNYAFCDCEFLSSVTICKSIESIGDDAFDGCKSLTDVYFNGTDCDWEKINIGIENDPLNNATMHFNSLIFTNHALVLSGEIGVIFNVSVPEGTEVEKVTFAIGKNGCSEMSAADAVYDSDSGEYSFTCYVGAYNMADKIYPTLVYTEGDEQKSLQGASYSVKKYIDYVRANPLEYEDKVIALVNALADYGHYSQVYLGDIHGYTCGNREKDKYAEMTTYATDSFDYGTVLGKVQSCAPSAGTDSEKISKVSFTLDLESKPNLYIDIEVKDGVVPDSAALADGTPLPVEQKSRNVYRVSINGINAINLTNKYTVTVKAGEDTIATVTVSPMSYVYKVLSAQDGPLTESDIRNTVCAFYNYSVAAYAAAQGTGIVTPVNPDEPAPYTPG